MMFTAICAALALGQALRATVPAFQSHFLKYKHRNVKYLDVLPTALHDIRQQFASGEQSVTCLEAES